MLVWVDTETTGLEFDHDLLLEVGMVVTDDDLNVKGTFSVVIKPPSLPEYPISEVVKEMHRVSGLWEDVLTIGVPIHQAELQCLEFLVSQFSSDPIHQHPMCGNNVGFDRRMLHNQMPLLHQFFHYRNIDVSSLKELFRRWNPSVFAMHENFKPEVAAHRAIADCLASIEELRIYRNNGMVTELVVE